MSEQINIFKVQQQDNISTSVVSEFSRLLDRDIEQVKTDMQLIASHSLHGTQVGAILEDIIDTSGKLIRPRLVLLCSSLGSLYEQKRDRLCKLAAMVELTHLASLIHDDIIDDAPFRRGERSVQGRYGKNAAVYAGDFIISRINYYLASEGSTEAAMLLSRTIEHMCEGEIGQATCRFREDVTTDQYLWNISGKTTALFRTACRLGAMESGCTPDIVNRLSEFGECLGTMFQLRDDLLDFTSDKSEIGKETHKDFRDGIYTMPVILALKDPKCREILHPIMKRNSVEELSDMDIRFMEETVVRFGGTEAACAEIHKMNLRCSAILDEIEEAPAIVLLRGILKLLDC